MPESKVPAFLFSGVPVRGHYILWFINIFIILKSGFMFYRKEVIVPAAYNPYIQAANENELTDALRKSTKQFRKLLKNIPGKKIYF